MKFFINLITCLLFCAASFAQGPLITEISYDNNYDQNSPFGIDSTEYVEIYLPDPQPTDLTSFRIATYDEVSGTPTDAEVAFVKDLTDTLRTWKTPNGKYYVIEFIDSSFFGFPVGGMRDGEDGVALIEIGTPNIVHQFWRYETCTNFTAIDGPALGAISDPITTDFSRTCGSSGVSLVQMNSALSTNRSLQQNGFGDWGLGLNSAQMPPLENSQNVPVEMMYFNVNNVSDYVNLTWATAQEYDNDYFSIRHSRDGKKFREIALVDGKGNYTGESRYAYKHEGLEKGRHYYQIRQVDYNGVYEDFDIRSVDLKSQESSIIAIPSSTQSDFRLSNIEEGTEVSIFNINGQLVKHLYYSDDRVDVSELTNGLYIIHVKEQVLRINKL